MPNNNFQVSLGKLIRIENNPVQKFEGEKKYISTGDFETNNFEIVTYKNRPSRANLTLSVGQVTLAKMKGTEKVKIVTKDMEDNIYSTGLFAIKPKAIDLKYLSYLFQSSDFIQEKDSLSFGTTQPSINEDRLKSIKVHINDDAKQQASIAYFLDSKVALIDELIDVEEKKISQLQEYKENLIYSTVLCGVEKQNITSTNYEYIKKINANYDLKPIGSLFKIEKRIIGYNTDKVLSITQKGIVKKNLSTNEGQLAESYENYQIVEVGDFAMNHMDLLTGWVDISKYDGVTSPDYRVFKIRNSGLISRYFLYVFQSYYSFKVFYGFGQGVSFYGRWRLPAQNFKKIMIPYPPINEQQKIVDYLDKKCLVIDKLIELKRTKIKKLEEYKKSTIYEYVSGKKEVTA